jgi:hypothetical protein
MTVTLASLRRQMEQLRAFAAERERLGKIPLTIFILPHNDRCPASEAKGPWPRVLWRSERAVCITYDLDAGQPSAREIRQLVDGAA